MAKINKRQRAWFDKPSSSVSKRMQKVKSKNTGLEKKMETLLKSQGIKYQRQPLISGKPDFRIKNTNVLLFCDSSFWHGRWTRDILGKAFKKNRAFWVNKLKENKKRDSKIKHALKNEGWKVLRFWDTDILRKPEKIIKKLGSMKRALNF